MDGADFSFKVLIKDISDDQGDVLKVLKVYLLWFLS